MATINVTEYAELARDASGAEIAAGKEPNLGVQTITFTTNTNNTAFDSAARFLRLISDTDCYLAFGEDGTSPSAGSGASPTGWKLKANTVEFVGIRANAEMGVYDGVS